jgi:sulfite exporter TauE/SafE
MLPMPESLKLLSTTAVSIAFLHTLLGPDHYLPFIVLGEAKKWSLAKTMLITFLCGLGHVLSSIIIGFIGIAAGVAVNKLVGIEAIRGNVAAWLFIAFGLVYMIIALKNLAINKKHTHLEHLSEETNSKFKTTPWILFLIFAFGPCEPLIPILMYPAAQNNISGVILVSLLFSVVTIITMLTVVLLFRFGLTKISFKPLEKYSHVLAGFIIFMSGAAIQFLGL